MSLRPRRPVPLARAVTLTRTVPVVIAVAALVLACAGCANQTTSETAVTDTSSTTLPPTTAAPTTTIDPGTLPQTEAKPTASGEQWDRHTQALWQAVVADDPDLALPFFFPLAAYRQVKAISDPAHDYETRLIRAYSEDIHALHQQLGESASRAQLVSIDVPASQWITPGVEYNKGGYWRVLDSTLTYRVDPASPPGGGSGTTARSTTGTTKPVTKTMNIKSMISWRGEWYVVHLTAIR